MAKAGLRRPLHVALLLFSGANVCRERVLSLASAFAHFSLSDARQVWGGALSQTVSLRSASTVLLILRGIKMACAL